MRALITGASRNIGAAIARGYAQAGADLVLVARDTARLEKVAADVRLAVPDREIVALTADISVPEGADRIVAAVHDGGSGTLDVLVNNAATTGGVKPTPAAEVADDLLLDVHATNVLGPLRLVRGLVPLLRRSRTGSIVNLLSGAGFQPVAGRLAYGMSKAALWAMTRYLAVELAPDVRVNALVPGVVGEDGAPRTAGSQHLVNTVCALRRAGRPEEMVGAAIYLASRAASYTRGTVLFCNGARAW